MSKKPKIKGKEPEEGARSVVSQPEDQFVVKFNDSATFKKWIDFLAFLTEEICLSITPNRIRVVIETVQQENEHTMSMYNESLIEAHQLVEFTMEPEKEHIIIVPAKDLNRIMKGVTSKQSVIAIEKRKDDLNLWFKIDDQSFPLTPIIRTPLRLVEPPRFEQPDSLPLCVAAVSQFGKYCGTISRIKGMYTRIRVHPHGLYFLPDNMTKTPESTIGRLGSEPGPIVGLPTSLLGGLDKRIDKISNPFGAVQFYYEKKDDVPFLKLRFGIGNYGYQYTYLRCIEDTNS